jgi:hypothetical protein
VRYRTPKLIGLRPKAALEADPRELSGSEHTPVWRSATVRESLAHPYAGPRSGRRSPVQSDDAHPPMRLANDSAGVVFPNLLHMQEAGKA